MHVHNTVVVSTIHLLWVVSLVWAEGYATGRSAVPSPPPGALQPFVEARQAGDIEALRALLRQVGQPDTKEAALAIVYAGLSERILDGLSPVQTQHLLGTAQEVLTRMTAARAWKVTYKAVSKHPDWQGRSMLLDVLRTRLPDHKRAQKALVSAIADSTDAVAIKAIEMAGELKIERAVPKLMRVVIAKWGQHVGVSVAKAILALERLTGSSEPAAWHAWVNEHL